MTRRLLAPRWLGLHLLTVVLMVVLVRIGLWQWGRGQDTGRIQNYSYGVEWWLFAAFTVFMWGKLVLDEVRPEQVEQVASRRIPASVSPAFVPLPDELPDAAAAVHDDDDGELAAYNRHLAWLNSNPRS